MQEVDCDLESDSELQENQLSDIKVIIFSVNVVPRGKKAVSISLVLIVESEKEDPC